MTKDITVQEGNKLIAEFMGGIVKSDLTCQNYSKMQIPDWAFKTHDFDTLKIGGYKYHTSWDWLMPVVEKITSLGFIMEIIISSTANDVFITKGKERLYIVAYSKTIDAVYTAVIQFIRWYNSQTKSTPIT